MKTITVRVEGRVQGVCFRLYTKRFADSHGILGWVKNMPDGTVLIKAQGPDKGMIQFLEDVRIGSPSSAVSELKTDVSEESYSFDSFEITY